MLQPSPPALLWGGYATGSDKAGFAVVRLPRMVWRPHQRACELWGAFAECRAARVRLP